MVVDVYVNATRTLLVRIEGDGWAELAMRDSDAGLWGPPERLHLERRTGEPDPDAPATRGDLEALREAVEALQPRRIPVANIANDLLGMGEDWHRRFAAAAESFKRGPGWTDEEGLE